MTMTREEHATNMIEKIKQRIDKCEPMSMVLVVQTSEFIGDSYNNREISQDIYDELRHRLRTTANQFPLNCECTKKKK